MQSQLDHILDEARRCNDGRRTRPGLDDFKGINEQYSYQAGDCLLRGWRIACANRRVAWAHWRALGGDQFVLVLSGIEQPYEVAELAQAVLDDLDNPIDLTATRFVCAPPSASRCTPRMVTIPRSCCKAEQT